ARCAGGAADVRRSPRRTGSGRVLWSCPTPMSWCGCAWCGCERRAVVPERWAEHHQAGGAGDLGAVVEAGADDDLQHATAEAAGSVLDQGQKIEVAVAVDNGAPCQRAAEEPGDRHAVEHHGPGVDRRRIDGGIAVDDDGDHADAAPHAWGPHVDPDGL